MDGEIKLKNGTNIYLEKEKLYAEKKAEFDEKEKKLIIAENKRDNYLNILFSFNQTAINIVREEKRINEIEIKKKYNTSVENFLNQARIRIDEASILLEEGRKKLDEANETITEKSAFLENARGLLANKRQLLNIIQDILWAATHCLFIIGAIVGAFTAKYVIDKFGLKNGILVHYLFSIVGGALMFSVPYSDQLHIFLPAIFIKLSRFFYGLQGGNLIQCFIYLLNYTLTGDKY